FPIFERICICEICSLFFRSSTKFALVATRPFFCKTPLWSARPKPTYTQILARASRFSMRNGCHLAQLSTAWSPHREHHYSQEPLDVPLHHSPRGMLTLSTGIS